MEKKKLKGVIIALIVVFLVAAAYIFCVSFLNKKDKTGNENNNEVEQKEKEEVIPEKKLQVYDEDSNATNLVIFPSATIS